MATPLRTPLYDAHLQAKARIVDFHGWEMPIQYTSILDEHAAVRNRAGLFDLSHMGRVRIRGAGRRAFLQKLVTIDVDSSPPGRCRYTFFLTEKGTVIDDLIFYAGTDDDLLVVNASNRERDLDWMHQHKEGDVEIHDETAEVALLAIQGPQSLEIVRKILKVDPGSMKYYTHDQFGEVMLSRTGYTGEDGFEIFTDPDRANELWKNFILAGVTPVGLGARDTLRTEAGMPLYGNELDEKTTPLEAGLKFAVDLDKPPFIGQEALKAAGKPARRLVGMHLDSRRIARHGYGVWHNDAQVGTVSSGTHGHAVGRSIAMAYVPPGTRKTGTEVEIDIRGKRVGATVVKLPFYRREKS